MRRRGWGGLWAALWMALSGGGCLGSGPGQTGSALEPADAGAFLDDAGPSGGDADAGPASPDGGTEGGTDGGVSALALPVLPGWTFWGPQHGGPRKVLGVSSDRGGNVWVAGGDEGLYLLEPGAARLTRFTHQHGLAGYTDSNGVHGYNVLSVAGGPKGTVYVGYEGLFAGMEDNDPPELRKSGDADRVVWRGGTLIQATHLDISTPPGVEPAYPQGRDKIRSVLRILYDDKTGDVWFGGNHGVALLQNRNGELFEHQHLAINGYDAHGTYTLLSGDWAGVALDGAGDLWMGGGHRLGKLHYGSEGQNFWATTAPVLDVWPDAKEGDAYPFERTDDFVQDLAITANGEVWVGSIPNGLACLTPQGPVFVRQGLVDPKVTALEVDPENGSLWVGHIWGGLSRLFPDGHIERFDDQVLGMDLVKGQVLDIQSDRVGGKRRILVAFESGAVGIYTGK